MGYWKGSGYIASNNTNDHYNKWIHWCYINDGDGTNKARVFQNNNNLGNGTNDRASFGGGAIALGYNLAVANWWGGDIDSVKVWTRAITDEEVEEDYNAGSGCEAPFTGCSGGGGGGGAMIHLNLTINSPINGTWYGLDQIEGNNSQFWINLTHNATGDYTVNINDTRFSLDSNTSTERIYLNNTFLDTGYYHITANLTQFNSTNATDFTIFFIDIVTPNIDPLNSLVNNQTYVWNGTLTTQINFTDDHEIYSINVSFSNGTVIFNATDMGVTSYSLNISYGVDPTVVGGVDITLCDSHTKNNIKDIDHKQSSHGIKYVMDKWLFFDTEWVKIYPKNPSNNKKPSTSKNRDRYSFTLPRSNVYIVESSHFIDIPKAQKFPGHLVIPGIGDNGYWVDLANDEANGYLVKRISPTKVEIVVAGLRSDLITFNSIGELNCISARYWYNNLNPVTGYDNETIAGQSRTFYLNITDHTDFISSLNATIYYNNTPYYGGTSSNFSAGYTVPLFHGLNTTKHLNWVLEVNGNSHNLITYPQYVHNSFLDNCSNSSFFRSADVYFKKVDDDSAIIVNATLSVEGDVNYYDDYEVSSFGICVYPSFVNLSEEFNVQFSNGGTTQYYVNDFYFSNTSHTTIDLYVQSGASTTTFTIKDKDTSEELDDVYATMYRLIDGTWIVMESKYSDITGRVQFSYQTDIAYRFLLTKETYDSYSFDLNPIIFSEYDILMERDITSNQSQDYDKVAVYYYPTVFYDGRENNFTFMIHSPYEELNLYGYTLTYPGGSVSNSGTAPVGEILTDNFTITGATVNDRLKLDYHYETDIAGNRNFTYYYSIAFGNYTMISNKDRTYGLGLIERVLISVFIVLFVVGISTLIGQPLPGFGLGLIMLGYLSYIGFMPLWAVLLPIAIGLIILGSRPEG